MTAGEIKARLDVAREHRNAALFSGDLAAADRVEQRIDELLDLLLDCASA